MTWVVMRDARDRLKLLLSWVERLRALDDLVAVTPRPAGPRP